MLDQFTFGEGRILPDYGTNVAPDALEGFALSTDGGAMGAGATQLWAAADPETDLSPAASLTILRHTDAGWTQVTPAVPGTTTPSCASGPALSDPMSPLRAVTDDSLASVWPHRGPGTARSPQCRARARRGSRCPTRSRRRPPNPNGFEPDVALIDASGCIQALDNPDDQDSTTNDRRDLRRRLLAGVHPGRRPGSPPGAAGPIDCPADNDCWMADSDGWLYHYTDGTQYPVDGDPNFAGVITVRPADGATVTVFGDVAPPDDSGTGQTYVAPTGPPAKVVIRKKGVVVRLTGVKAHVVHRTELVLTFHLNTRARIEIIAERHGKVVGHSRAAGARRRPPHVDPEAQPQALAEPPQGERLAGDEEEAEVNAASACDRGCWRPRLLLVIVAAALVCDGLVAGPAHAAISASQVLDGPTNDILDVDGAALAPDGTGGIVYRKEVDGVDHVFAVPVDDGHWGSPVEVDPGDLYGAASRRSAPRTGAACSPSGCSRGRSRPTGSRCMS